MPSMPMASVMLDAVPRGLFDLGYAEAAFACGEQAESRLAQGAPPYAFGIGRIRFGGSAALV